MRIDNVSGALSHLFALVVKNVVVYPDILENAASCQQIAPKQRVIKPCSDYFFSLRSQRAGSVAFKKFCAVFHYVQRRYGRVEPRVEHSLFSAEFRGTAFAFFNRRLFLPWFIVVSFLRDYRLLARIAVP